MVDIEDYYKKYGVFNMFKARNGEFFIEHLLKKLDYKVFRFGYETTLQNLLNLDIKLKPSKTSDMIYCMPDFLVIDPKGNMMMIEVKVRTNLRDVYIKEDIEKIKKHYPECLLVVIDGEKNNPIKACYVKDYKSLDDLKNFWCFLSFSADSDEHLGAMMDIQDFAEWIVRFDKNIKEILELKNSVIKKRTDEEDETPEDEQ